MKKPNITPGIWIADDRYVYAENGDTIAVVYADKDHPQVAITDAKAISAVPDMIDALIHTIGIFESLAYSGVDKFVMEEEIKNIQQCLKKAGFEYRSEPPLTNQYVT